MDRLVAAKNIKWLATGHYAGIEWTNSVNPRPKLVRAADKNKDQTYYLSGVSEASLRRVRTHPSFCMESNERFIQACG